MSVMICYCPDSFKLFKCLQSIYYSYIININRIAKCSIRILQICQMIPISKYILNRKQKRAAQ